MKHILAAAAFALGVTEGSPAPEETAPARSVAVVADLTGTAHVVMDASDGPALHALEWLPEGIRIHVDAKSSVTLVFLNGSQYELGEGATVSLHDTGVADATGPVARLEGLPVMPDLAGIDPAEQPGARSAAIRVRGSAQIRGLYPGSGAAALAGSTVLTFTGVSGVDRYRVRLEDETALIVLQQVVNRTSVPVPANRLQPGRGYVWTVDAELRTGEVIMGQAEFRTLPSAAVLRREAFRSAAADRDLALLAAEVDRRLGLLCEARATLLALRLEAQESQLSALLSEVQEALGEVVCLQTPTSSSR